MKTKTVILSLILSIMYGYAQSNDTIYDPISTPIYVGKTLFCSMVQYYPGDTLCDSESSLVIYSSDVKDTLQGALTCIVHFDTENVGLYQEIPVVDITDIEFVKPQLVETAKWSNQFREELLTLHWWTGKYINPLTFYPKQTWTFRYRIIPQNIDPIRNEANMPGPDSTYIAQEVKKCLCDGDMTAYEDLISLVPYYDYFAYSIYVANTYDYAPAYYRAYRIYQLWNELYHDNIDETSWKNLKIWLEWGRDAGSKACEILLRDSTHVTKDVFASMDSINHFTFTFPIEPCDGYIHAQPLGYDSSITISCEEFEKIKQKRISEDSEESNAILELYAHGFADRYTVSENFLFRIRDHIKCNRNENITLSVVWEFSNICNVCKQIDLDELYSSKLGLHLLHVGLKAGDKFSFFPLAKLYAQGNYVPLDRDFAYQLLLKMMRPELAEKWLQRLIQDDNTPQ